MSDTDFEPATLEAIRQIVREELRAYYEWTMSEEAFAVQRRNHAILARNLAEAQGLGQGASPALAVGQGILTRDQDWS